MGNAPDKVTLARPGPHDILAYNQDREYQTLGQQRLAPVLPTLTSLLLQWPTDPQNQLEQDLSRRPLQHEPGSSHSILRLPNLTSG